MPGEQSLGSGPSLGEGRGGGGAEQRNLCSDFTSSSLQYNVYGSQVRDERACLGHGDEIAALSPPPTPGSRWPDGICQESFRQQSLNLCAGENDPKNFLDL